MYYLRLPSSAAEAAVGAAARVCVLLEAALVGCEGGCNSNCDILHRSRVGQKPIRGPFGDPSGMTASSLCLQQAFFEFPPYAGGPTSGGPSGGHMSVVSRPLPPRRMAIAIMVTVALEEGANLHGYV